MTILSKVASSLRAKARTAKNATIVQSVQSAMIAAIVATATGSMVTMAMVVAAISLTACSSPNPDVASPIGFNSSCDVDLKGWNPTDSLVFPILVTNPPTLRNPIHAGQCYSMLCNIRIAPEYPYTTVPMHLIVQQTDTLSGGHQHVVRNLLRQEINPAVRDSLGHPLGATWGSLIDYEAPLSGDISLKFDSAGTYRMILIPLTPDQSSLSGISSVGLTLKVK